MKALQPGDYQIGIVCALSKEMTAVRAILDEEHARLQSQDSKDHNSYVLGQVHEHNVVIACLPAGVYGTTSAATVGKDMLRTFENIRLGLMVGIGGGIPQEGHDIRLGDVVVSRPDKTHGGVVQYDLGKNLGGGRFERKGALSKPPKALLTALSLLQSDYHFQRDIISKTLAAIEIKYPVLSELYHYPGVDQDQLCCAHCHPTTQSVPSRECNMCIDGKIQRPNRRNKDPVIHYGTIASGNQLLKNAKFRDQLAREEGAIAVEMEAAGLVDTFPCLVVRGICDYADSCKNDVWQNFAAVTAAVCAKEIICRVTSQQVNQEKVVSLLDTVNKRLELQEIRYQDERHRQCHRTLKTSTYEGFKNINPDAVSGTCRWVLDNPIYLDWYEKSGNEIIWISADPGCGKSVLSKSLVDLNLQRSNLIPGPDTAKWFNTRPSLCYFFFKDNEQQNSLSIALCAILHQLFSQQPTLIRHAIPAYDTSGDMLPRDTDELWRILLSATSDAESRPVFCVLDALDECRATDQRQLLEFLRRFSSKAITNDTPNTFKWLITSRPYVDIEDGFERIALECRSIRLRGEDESDQIREEINIVIRQRMAELARELKLSDTKKDEITQQLLNMKHRTYLWLYLAIDDIKSTFRSSLRPFQQTIVLLPPSVEAAYEKILARVTGEHQKNIARTILTIVVGARRALTTHEMAYALDLATLNKPPATLGDLTITASHVKDNISKWCGLFVFINHERLYLLHQTAREFLLSSDNNSIDNHTGWKHCLQFDAVEREMAKICVLFLCLGDFNEISHEWDVSHPQVKQFFDYAAKHWSHYVRHNEEMLDNATKKAMQTLYNTSSPLFSKWTSAMWHSTSRFAQVFSMNAIQLAAFNGHHVFLEDLLQTKYQGIIDVADVNGYTALTWAAEMGNLDAAKVLLDYRAEQNLRNSSGQTALHWASDKGHTQVVELLFRYGVNPRIQDGNGETALHWAAGRGRAEVIEVLLKHSADIELQASNGRTALHKASGWGHIQVVEILLKHGANFSIQDNYGKTALVWASGSGYIQVVETLLKHGAKLNVPDNIGRTALLKASGWGHIQVVEILLKHGANFSIQDNYGKTALVWASERGHTQVAETLLKHGAKVNIQDNYGKTALAWASEQGHTQVVKALLEHGAKVNIQDISGDTALHIALHRGRVDVIEVLLKQGIEVNSQDKYGWTTFYWATQRCPVQAVEVLLEHGAEVNSQDESGWTALHEASYDGKTQLAGVLLKHGADVNLQDYYGETALYWASEGGYSEVIELLLKAGAVVYERDVYAARRRGYGDVVDMLLPHQQDHIKRSLNPSSLQ